MADLPTLSDTDLTILEIVSRGTGRTPTRFLAEAVQLSTSQVLKRTKLLESQGFLTHVNGGARKRYQFFLSSQTSRAAVLAELRSRPIPGYDLVARSTLLTMSETFDQISGTLTYLSNQIRGLLGEQMSKKRDSP